MDHVIGLVDAPMLTYDPDVDCTLAVLRFYADLWQDCPLRFLIPVNSLETERKLQRGAPKKLVIKTVPCESAIDKTLKAILNVENTSSVWIYWCNSDRYPIAIADAAWLNNLSRLALQDGLGGLIDGQVKAIRLTRWKETQNLLAAHTPVLGRDCLLSPISMYGFYHHQFIRRDYLRRLLTNVEGISTLAGMHNRLMELKLDDDSALILEHPLIKFEEPTVGHRRTLNYAFRQAPDNIEKIDEVSACTVAFCSANGPKLNNFWARKQITVSEVLTRQPPPDPFVVVSYGGTGSKQICRWIKQETSKEAAHSHLRIPFSKLKAGQKLLYVFGDPRNTVLSLFQRRSTRHGRHGHQVQSSAQLEQSMPEFPLLHCDNIEADAGPMNKEWDLSTFLENGLDLFRLEEHFDFWIYSNAPYDTVFVRYEQFFDVAQLLASTFGFPCAEAPKFVRRRADWLAEDDKTKDRLSMIYSSFSDRLLRLPNLFSVRDSKILDLQTGKPFSPEGV